MFISYIVAMALGLCSGRGEECRLVLTCCLFVLGAMSFLGLERPLIMLAFIVHLTRTRFKEEGDSGGRESGVLLQCLVSGFNKRIVVVSVRVEGHFCYPIKDEMLCSNLNGSKSSRVPTPGPEVTMIIFPS